MLASDQSPPDPLPLSSSAIACETVGSATLPFASFFFLGFLTEEVPASASSSLSLSFLSLNRDVMPAREFRRASFPMEPILRMTTEAEDMVEESEMLSVEALRRELNKDAARDRFLPGLPTGAVLPPTAVPEVPAVRVLAASFASVGLGVSAPFTLELAPASSSSSCSACAAFKESARRNLFLSPPLLTVLVLPRPMAEFSSIAARSESSLEMRRSAWALACTACGREVEVGLDGEGVA